MTFEGCKLGVLKKAIHFQTKYHTPQTNGSKYCSLGMFGVSNTILII